MVFPSLCFGGLMSLMPLGMSTGGVGVGEKLVACRDPSDPEEHVERARGCLHVEAGVVELSEKLLDPV